MKYKNILLFILLAIILLIPLVDLLHPGFAITHDGQDHIARIANFYINLQQGVLIPRWAPNLDWGYGHPILMFLYPLPSYIASLFHFTGLSLIDSTKIVFFLGMFLSGFTMYAWLSRLWGKPAGFFGAILYVIAPYRLVELYVRGDIGENFAFIFIPLVLLFIDNLSIRRDKKDILWGSICFALLILSHNAISLMFVPFFALYCLYTLYVSQKNKKSLFVRLLVMFGLGFGLSAFFWIPGLVEGRFTLRNIVTTGEYKDRFVSFNQLLYGPWDYGGSGLFTVQLGIMNWIALIVSFVLLPILFIKKNKNSWLVVLLIFYTLVSIFLMVSLSNFIWAKVMLLQNFQFPWRFLAIIVFTTAVLGAFLIHLIPSSKYKVTVTVIGVLLILFFNKDYWHAKGYMQKNESFFTGIYDSTTDTGESAPIWSVRFMEHRPKAPLELIDGHVKIQQNIRKVTYHQYTVISVGSSLMMENTLYFPGWTITVDGKEVPIQFQNKNYRGLMTFVVPNGKHTVVVEFRETKLRLISDIISLCSIAVLIGLLFKKI